MSYAYAPARDKNHKAMTETLHARGYSTVDCSAVGRGFTDLVVGAPGLTIIGVISRAQRMMIMAMLPSYVRVWKGVTVLVELKNPELAKSKRKLRTKQAEFSRQWPGPTFVMEAEKDIAKEFGEHKFMEV